MCVFFHANAIASILQFTTRNGTKTVIKSSSSFRWPLWIHSVRYERAEEKSCEINKHYNRLLQALDKCNEWADTTQRLQLLIEEQCGSMQTLENQCKEMVDNIEDSTCTVLFFRSQIGCLYS